MSVARIDISYHVRCLGVPKKPETPAEGCQSLPMQWERQPKVYS